MLSRSTGSYIRFLYKLFDVQQLVVGRACYFHRLLIVIRRAGDPQSVAVYSGGW